MPQVTATAHIFPSANDLVGTNPSGDGRTSYEKNLTDKWIANLFLRNAIISGGQLPASDPDLTITVPTGKAFIAGRYVEWAAINITLAASNVNHLWIRILRDANTNASSVVIEHNTIGTDPDAANSVKLGTVTTSAGAVTGTADQRPFFNFGWVDQLTAGPFVGPPNAPGDIWATGADNSIGVVRRNATAFVASAAGDVFMFYSPDGGKLYLSTPVSGNLVEFFPTTNEGVRFLRGLVVDVEGGLLADFPNYPARIRQQVNGQYCLELIRQTDSNPSGSVLRVINAAYTDPLVDIAANGIVSSHWFATNSGQSYFRDDGLYVSNAANVAGVAFSGGIITSPSVGLAALRIGIGSQVSAGAAIILMHDESFFPATWNTGGISGSILRVGSTSDPGNQVGRFYIDVPVATCGAQWKYVTSSDNPHIYVTVDSSSHLQVVWTADDPLTHGMDEWVDDPDNPGLLRHVRTRIPVSMSPLATSETTLYAVPLSTLTQIAIPQRILDSADKHIEREKLKPENRLFRALQFHAKNEAPAMWLMENCGWDGQGGVIRELKENEKRRRPA